MLAYGPESQDGILLLRSIRAYVELDMLASLEIHTDHTITWGRTALTNFAKFAEVSFHIFTRTTDADAGRIWIEIRPRELEFP